MTPFKPPRRKRFEAGKPKFGMTPAKGQLLFDIARCGMLTTRQIVRLTGRGKSGVYKHLSDLKDHKLVQPYSAPYSDFAPPSSPTPAVSWAPGENLYTVTKTGLKWLVDGGYLGDSSSVPEPSVPTRGLFMAHQILVQDVRVWLERCSLSGEEGRLVHWVAGDKAHFSCVRPDAWFLNKLPSSQTLVGMLEADRGTMRGAGRMADKARGYAALLGSAELAEATGGRKSFRLMVVTLDEARRERLVAEMALPGIADRLFVATVSDLAEEGLSRPVWRTAGMPGLVPVTWQPAS